MKINNTISIALMAFLTLGAGSAMATSTDTSEMMKADGMEKMGGEMLKKDGMQKMDGEMMKKDGMEKMDEMNKMDGAMKNDEMENMDGEMKKGHKKEAVMGS
jgi:hypothetical protein